MEEGKARPGFRSTSIAINTNREYEQSDICRPNDVLIEDHRLSNLSNSQDKDWHNEQIRPIRGLWSMIKVLEYEPLIDESITKLCKSLKSLHRSLSMARTLELSAQLTNGSDIVSSDSE